MKINNERFTYDHTFNGLVLGLDIRWSLKTNVESTRGKINDW